MGLGASLREKKEKGRGKGWARFGCTLKEGGRERRKRKTFFFCFCKPASNSNKV
jgi:hypothetical protein